jgi:hypothetical protein
VVGWLGVVLEVAGSDVRQASDLETGSYPKQAVFESTTILLQDHWLLYP